MNAISDFPIDPKTGRGRAHIAEKNRPPMSVSAETIMIVGTLHKQVLDLRTALEDALDAIDFARTEGFEWPTDPYTAAILNVCPPIRLTAKEPTEEANDV